jgi:2'-hydroxyisoflavone reductase
MKLLVLGGTRFLGRHVVEAALTRGHAVTIFTRGKLPVPWGDRVAARVGERDPRLGAGLQSLATGEWDCVVDCSGYVPRIVGASAELLASRVGRYLFVSSVSVYAESTQAGVDEGAKRLPLSDPATEDVLANYGALKAACEDAVAASYGERATLVRPGLIVGSHDGTDRFGYWVARFVHPALLGDRPARAVVPAPAAQGIQVIDARDHASFIVGLAERNTGGSYNAISPPGHWSMGDLVAALQAASPSAPRPAWVDDAKLLEHKVEPWVGLPLWIPQSDPDHAGFFAFDTRRAQAAGLAVRPLADTIADTAAWLAQRDNTGAWKLTLSADAERAILG